MGLLDAAQEGAQRSPRLVSVALPRDGVWWWQPWFAPVSVRLRPPPSTDWRADLLGVLRACGEANAAPAVNRFLRGLRPVPWELLDVLRPGGPRAPPCGCGFLWEGVAGLRRPLAGERRARLAACLEATGPHATAVGRQSGEVLPPELWVQVLWFDPSQALPQVDRCLRGHLLGRVQRLRLGSAAQTGGAAGLADPNLFEATTQLLIAPRLSVLEVELAEGTGNAGASSLGLLGGHRTLTDLQLHLHHHPVDDRGLRDLVHALEAPALTHVGLDLGHTGMRQAGLEALTGALGACGGRLVRLRLQVPHNRLSDAALEHLDRALGSCRVLETLHLNLGSNHFTPIRGVCPAPLPPGTPAGIDQLAVGLGQYLSGSLRSLTLDLNLISLGAPDPGRGMLQGLAALSRLRSLDLGLEACSLDGGLADVGALVGALPGLRRLYVCAVWNDLGSVEGLCQGLARLGALEALELVLANNPRLGTAATAERLVEAVAGELQRLQSLFVSLLCCGERPLVWDAAARLRHVPDVVLLP